MERLPRPQAQQLHMVRSVLPAHGGVRLLYTSPTGDYLGEVTILGIGQEAMQAMVNDLHDYAPVFLAQQARMAMRMPLQGVS